jgi:fructose-bisphosphate aldolase class II
MSGYKVVASMVSSMMEALKVTVPVALHLDHGSYDGALAAANAGFSSIMFDGSHYTFEENIQKTKEMVDLCKKMNLSLEVELGTIGGEEDGVIGAGDVADVEECRKMSSLGVDMLAAGIGNIHGAYPDN